MRFSWHSSTVMCFYYVIMLFMCIKKKSVFDEGQPWIFHIITQAWCSRAIQAAGNPYRRAASHSVMHRLVFYCERNRSRLLSLECSGKGRQLREKAMNRMSRLITNAMAGFYHSRAASPAICCTPFPRSPFTISSSSPQLSHEGLKCESV